VERHSADLWCAENIWKHLRQCLALKIEISACVAHCRLKAGVTQKLADGPEVNARLKQVDCRGVAEGVRVYLAAPGRRQIFWEVLSQKISNAESRQLNARAVFEYKRV
jgi:hypothetical protein